MQCTVCVCCHIITCTCNPVACLDFITVFSSHICIYKFQPSNLMADKSILQLYIGYVPNDIGCSALDLCICAALPYIWRCTPDRAALWRVCVPVIFQATCSETSLHTSMQWLQAAAYFFMLQSCKMPGKAIT